MKSKQIALFGTSFKQSDIKLREKIAFTPEEISTLLPAILQNTPAEETVILSTCNRTEVYISLPEDQSVREYMHRFLAAYRKEIDPEEYEHFYIYTDEAACHHLFRVTSGLESMVLGEPQITGQVKDALKLAMEGETVKTLLSRMFTTALQVSKRVRTDTSVASGAVSVAYAAVELAQKIFRDLSKQKALLIGAGETGQLVARHLKKKGIGEIFITNRTFSKAEALAGELGAHPHPFESFKSLLNQVDLVIGSTGAPNCILSKDDVKTNRSSRKSSPLFFIDIAVPRDFDPEINKLSNVFLNDIDSLQQIVDHNLQKRRDELPLAEEMINEEVALFQKWRQSLTLTPTIVALREKFEAIREMELEKYRHRTDPDEFEQMERLSRGLLNKFLHLPLSQIKRFNDHDNNNGAIDSATKIHILREIFDLGE